MAAFCIITACSSTPKAQDTAKKALSGTDEQILLGDTIEKNYDPKKPASAGNRPGFFALHIDCGESGEITWAVEQVEE